MVIALPNGVMERLRETEAEEGVPVLEQIHLAVEIFSHLTVSERQMLGLMAMRLVAERARGGRS